MARKPFLNNSILTLFIFTFLILVPTLSAQVGCGTGGASGAPGQKGCNNSQGLGGGAGGAANGGNGGSGLLTLNQALGAGGGGGGGGVANAKSDATTLTTVYNGLGGKGGNGGDNITSNGVAGPGGSGGTGGNYASGNAKSSSSAFSTQVYNGKGGNGGKGGNATAISAGGDGGVGGRGGDNASGDAKSVTPVGYGASSFAQVYNGAGGWGGNGNNGKLGRNGGKGGDGGQGGTGAHGTASSPGGVGYGAGSFGILYNGEGGFGGDGGNGGDSNGIQSGGNGGNGGNGGRGGNNAHGDAKFTGPIAGYGAFSIAESFNGKGGIGGLGGNGGNGLGTTAGGDGGKGGDGGQGGTGATGTASPAGPIAGYGAGGYGDIYNDKVGPGRVGGAGGSGCNGLHAGQAGQPPSGNTGGAGGRGGAGCSVPQIQPPTPTPTTVPTTPPTATPTPTTVPTTPPTATPTTGSLAATTTTLTSSPVSPSNSGTSVTFSASVAGSGACVPTGTIQFNDGGISMGNPVALAAQTANISTSSLTTGTHTITADYSGDANCNASTDNLSFTVNTATVNTAFFSISGKVFIDTNGDNQSNRGELNYTATPPNISISPSAGITVANNADGSYSFTNVPSGTYTITYNTVPPNYHVYPYGPAAFSVTAGSGCVNPIPNPTTGGSCDASGNIINLNFALNNSTAWIQGYNLDLRIDSGFVDNVPSGASASESDSAIGSTPGVIFSGDGNPDFSPGQSSGKNWVVGGSSYPEFFSSTGRLHTSYGSLTDKISGAQLTTIDLASVCSGGISNCALPSNLSHGIYVAPPNSDVTITSFNPTTVSQNYIFLINGKLTVKGDITIPNGSTALFSSSGNIVIDKSVGAASNSLPKPAGQLQGFYSTDKNFVLEGKNNCPAPDKMLNVEGSIIMNAAGNGGNGKLINNRSLCGANSNTPSLTISPRLDFILNAPTFLMRDETISREVAP